jgi:hypothetical protein
MVSTANQLASPGKNAGHRFERGQMHGRRERGAEPLQLAALGAAAERRGAARSDGDSC